MRHEHENIKTQDRIGEGRSQNCSKEEGHLCLVLDIKVIYKSQN